VWVLRSLGSQSWSRTAGAFAGVTATLVLVTVFGGRLVPSPRPTHIAHLVQTNLPPGMSYPANWNQIHASDMQEIRRITVDSANRLPGPVIWPEVPAPFSLQEAVFAQTASGIARD